MKKISHRPRIVLTCVMLLLTFSFAATAYAHGVVITYSLKANGEVELQAEFDTGEAMAEAQVTVYSPEDPLTAWLTGTADSEGHYTFVIDPEMPGSWDIQFRKAGHGDIVHLQLEEGMIDPAMMDQAPGALRPDPPAAETIAAEAASSAGPETDAAAVEEKSELAEPAVKSEPVAQAKVEPEVDTAATETAVQVAPRPGGVQEETDEVAVLSSGGNTATAGGFTSFQILLMSGSVIWGFVGTALYFSGKKSQDHSHSHVHGHHH